MIGIDIIDLSDPLLKTRNNSSRFISHPEEEEIIDFWIYWAAKEAIFKAIRSPHTVFNPKEIPVFFQSDSSFVSGPWQGKILKPESGCLIAIVHHKSDQVNHIYSQKLNGNPSNCIRQEIAEYFLTNSEVETRVIAGLDGLPVLSHNQYPVSLSHHGRFMAAVWTLSAQ